MYTKLSKGARRTLLRLLNAMYRLLLLGLALWLGLAWASGGKVPMDLRFYALLCVLAIIITAIRRLLL